VPAIRFNSMGWKKTTLFTEIKLGTDADQANGRDIFICH